MRQTNAPVSLALTNEGIRSLGAPVEVRRHPGARRLTLRVSRARRAVIVTLPLQCGLDEADTFLKRNIGWIRERLDSLPRPVTFGDGVYMPFRGEVHRIVFSGRSGPRGVVRRVPGAPFPELHVAGEPEFSGRRLAGWLAEEARSDLDKAASVHSARLGVAPKRIAVRDQSSRWGSCSTTGVLSFSWRLIMAPPAILDYVAAHEVAHLKEMNHGPRFWAFVRSTYPNVDYAKRWLQIYGMDLHRYGPA